MPVIAVDACNHMIGRAIVVEFLLICVIETWPLAPWGGVESLALNLPLAIVVSLAVGADKNQNDSMEQKSQWNLLYKRFNRVFTLLNHTGVVYVVSSSCAIYLLIWDTTWLYGQMWNKMPSKTLSYSCALCPAGNRMWLNELIVNIIAIIQYSLHFSAAGRIIR